jgi:hypothetical protein
LLQNSINGKRSIYNIFFKLSVCLFQLISIEWLCFQLTFSLTVMILIIAFSYNLNFRMKFIPICTLTNRWNMDTIIFPFSVHFCLIFFQLEKIIWHIIQQNTLTNSTTLSDNSTQSNCYTNVLTHGLTQSHTMWSFASKPIKCYMLNNDVSNRSLSCSKSRIASFKLARRTSVKKLSGLIHNM